MLINSMTMSEINATRIGVSVNSYEADNDLISGLEANSCADCGQFTLAVKGRPSILFADLVSH